MILIEEGLEHKLSYLLDHWGIIDKETTKKGEVFNINKKVICRSYFRSSEKNEIDLTNWDFQPTGEVECGDINFVPFMQDTIKNLKLKYRIPGNMTKRIFNSFSCNIMGFMYFIPLYIAIYKDGKESRDSEFILYAPDVSL